MYPSGKDQDSERSTLGRQRFAGGDDTSEVAIEVEHLDTPEPAALVKLSGFLQRRGAQKLLETFKSLSAEGVPKIIFDMAEVQYANSSAISAFVNMASSAKAAGGVIVLLAMRSNIKKVFSTLGLTGLFNLATTREEALKIVS